MNLDFSKVESSTFPKSARTESYLGRSLAKAPLGLEFEIGLEGALESELECRFGLEFEFEFDFEFKSSNSSARWSPS